jgi:uncharacterized membrane protein YdbT with pleckstrin-like domain
MDYQQHFIFQIGLKLFASLIFFMLFLLSSPLMVVIPLGYAGYVYLSWKNYKVRIEDNKVILEYGVLSSHKEQIKIDKIQKIRTSRTLIQKIFKNLGTISLETGNDLTVYLENIQNYQTLHLELEKKIEEFNKS